jgi:hypothetical protein
VNKLQNVFNSYSFTEFRACQLSCHSLSLVSPHPAFFSPIRSWSLDLHCAFFSTISTTFLQHAYMGAEGTHHPHYRDPSLGRLSAASLGFSYYTWRNPCGPRRKSNEVIQFAHGHQQQHLDRLVQETVHVYSKREEHHQAARQLAEAHLTSVYAEFQGLCHLAHIPPEQVIENMTNNFANNLL